MKRIIMLIAGTAFLASCLTTKVKVNSTYEAKLPIDTINLTATMYGPLMQPTFPLIDAAAFNGKTNKIADQIMNEQQEALKSYQEIFIKALSEKINVAFKTGKDFTSEKASQFKAGQQIQIDNKNFPVVFFCEGDLNALDLGNGKNPNNIFKYNESVQANISKLANALGVNNILVCYNRLSVINVGMFGISGSLRLETYLYLYNSDGRVILNGFGQSKPTQINGSSVSEYKFQMDNFQELAQLFSTELSKYLE